MSSPETSIPPQPRQKFPTKKQALLIFFGSIVLSLTTCTSVLILFGERQLSDTGDFLVALAIYTCFFASVVGFIVLMMYFVRRRQSKRHEGVS
jgi:ABC-type sugar transport system permease subunit